MEMDATVKTLMDWLEGQTNNELYIRKTEDDDRDEVRLQLKEVGYRSDYKSIDGYTDGTALLLHGNGSIVTDTAEAPLPQDSYVIPISGLSVSKVSDDGVILKTERAHYSLSVDNGDRR
jgi:hypothetical protein